ncbi:MAG: hypothetical protein J6V41_02740 [Kiritimatiellae bacterium]|nr:hypothetical protein [Kiritimatiellia bacterium]
MNKLEEWEERLYTLLREIDGALEDKYGKLYPLHPARPQRGETANPQYDGLFRITASYSAGYGSKLGPGYIFRVELVTFEMVPDTIRQTIEAEAIQMAEDGLKRIFPERELSIARDGNVIKIYGDLSL